MLFTVNADEKVVLFLQGPPSVFWMEFAQAFEDAGARTIRVNFTLGDRLFWRKPGARNYRGGIGGWPRYLRRLIERHGVTDIVYYADRLPYHREAIRVGGEMNIRCHAVEWGYLRPDWITLERNGMGRLSHFPTEPERIRAIAAKAGDADIVVKYPHSFDQEASNEVIYNLLNFFGRPFYPFYSADKYYSALVDYLPWLAKPMRKRHFISPDFAENHSGRFFVVALQLQSDYQIRANSPFRHLEDMIRQVTSSFVRFAPKDAKLVFKQHPLDNGLERWDRVVAAAAREFRAGDRVVFTENGNLRDMITHAAGVVVVNSTVGLHSLQALRPTIALGCAVYDIAGLTHQRGLDEFWAMPAAVDPELLRDFVKALAATIQVKGDFFNPEGRVAAVGAMAQRVIGGTVNMPDAMVSPPPRLHSPKGVLAVPGGVELPEYGVQPEWARAQG